MCPIDLSTPKAVTVSYLDLDIDELGLISVDLRCLTIV
jgi:hypothetical protein